MVRTISVGVTFWRHILWRRQWRHVSRESTKKRARYYDRLVLARQCDVMYSDVSSDVMYDASEQNLSVWRLSYVCWSDIPLLPSRLDTDTCNMVLQNTENMSLHFGKVVLGRLKKKKEENYVNLWLAPRSYLGSKFIKISVFTISKNIYLLLIFTSARILLQILQSDWPRYSLSICQIV